MSNLDFIESKKYKLTCLSPVHIGSGESLKSFEYIYNKAKGEIWFVREPDWIALLGRHGLMEKFIGLIGRPGELSRLSLWDWLSSHKIPMRELEACVKRKSLVRADLKTNKNTLNDIAVGSNDAQGRLYIPGSSIKGAMRTGILFHLLKTNKAVHSRLVCDMQELVDKAHKGYKGWGEIRNGDWQRLTNDLEKSLLSAIEKRDGEDVTLKLLSGLKVGDARLVQNTDSVILQKVDVSTNSKDKRVAVQEKPLPIFRECIPAGTELELQISLDKKLMQQCGIGSVEDILQATREYMQQGLAMQKKVFGGKYLALYEEAGPADFFFGAGTGFLQKSLWFSLFSDASEARRELRDFLENKFYKHKHKSLDKLISPRTLKITKNDGDTQLMGMCRLEVLKDG